MQKKITERLLEYYRCPEQFAQFALSGHLSALNGYFRFGENVLCYGRCSGAQLKDSPEGELYDATRSMVIENGSVRLPFDPSEAVENLLFELYVGDWRENKRVSFLAELYYLVRPFLSVGVRRHLQKIHLAGWETIPFPRWPVDCSVDDLCRELLVASLKSSSAERIPFIWFWPNSASSCSLMTHDVETVAGQSFCPTLMDIDDSYGIKSSFQLVPEARYGATSEFLVSIRERGFEVVVHDLNHDGHLYSNRKQFLDRAARINEYGKAFGAHGFRAGVLYRKQLWFDALDFSYDMSVPNVAHLDPQRGGCCTVMPYFIGRILEMPVTTTQDYTLFHILKEYSNSLWDRQIDLIMARHGLMSFIVHPDYVMKSREQDIYRALLARLDQLRSTKGVWNALPRDVDHWWRQRRKMSLIEAGGEWRIEGEGKERAQVAFASLKDGRLSIDFHLQEDQRRTSP